jgi:Zn-dependent M28 family amino/carboxypeptidase
MNLFKSIVATIVLTLFISGLTWAQTIDTEELRTIGEAPSAERIEQDIAKLVSFGTRHTLSDTTSDSRGIGAARRWIKSEFEKISEACGGCLEVFYVRDIIEGEERIPEPVEVVNVIAIQRGTADPNRFVVMSGDIDSRVSDVMDATSDAPGANDNASGVAGVLEAARVLSKYEFEGSIMYAQLSGEEQGLFGGKILADYAKEQGWKIKGVLNNDMIGNIAGINGVVDNTTARVFSEGTRYVETEREARIRRFTGGEVDSPSRNLARYVNKMADRYIKNLDMMMIYRLDRFGRGGHHRPFNEAGYPGVRIMETNEHYDRQHQDLRTENGVEYGDVLEKVDFDYAAKLTGLNAAVMASMSWAPSPPSGVTISGAVQPSTTLSWNAMDKKENPQHAGYKIYWRPTTAPTWQKSVYVGDVTEYTLENVVIDNYFFGVASVSEDGFESPVVFPGPAGSFGD